MAAPEVSVAHGTAYDVLVAAAAVADVRWRDTFTDGQASYQRVVDSAGPAVAEQISTFGRFGWLNLVQLAPPDATLPWLLDDLLAAVRRCDPRALHLTAIGADRRQLIDEVGEAVLHGTVDGESSALARMRAVLDSNRLTVEISDTLMSDSSAAIQEAMTAALTRWREAVLPPDRESELLLLRAEQAALSRAELAEAGTERFLDSVAGGIHFDPGWVGPVIGIATDQVSPVVVVVDGSRRTTLLHPPLPTSQSTSTARDSTHRLLELSRALGDQTRLDLLALLRDGPRTAVELATALGAKRTTLLHHLAILRSAGLIEITVTPGGPTVYRLRPDALRELGSVAASFISTR